MTPERPSYQELEERCRRAEGMLAAIRSGQVDAVVGENQQSLVVRLAETEEALRRSEETFRHLAESTEAVPWEYDVRQDRWTYVAPQVERILGYPPAAWTDLAFWRDHLHPEDRDEAAAYCLACSARGEAHEFEYRFLHRDGHAVWIRDVVDVEMADGRPVTLRGFMVDISRLKETQRTLGERVKELDCLYRLSRVVEEGQSLAEILQGAVELIPPSWQCPPITRARIALGGEEHCAPVPCEACAEGRPHESQTARIHVEGGADGMIRVCYLEPRPPAAEGPFLAEERSLLDAVAERLGRVAERLRVREAVAHHQAMLSRTERIAHVGSWELNLETDTLTWSDEVYRIFGLRPREFEATYEAFLRAVHPEDREAVDQAYAASVAEGRPGYEIDHRILRRDTGEVRYVHEKCEHVSTADGRLILSLGMVHDITERKRAELALRESEENHRTTLNSIGDAVIATDAEGRVEQLNPVAERLTGWPSAEAAGRPLSEVFRIINERTREPVADPVARVLAAERVVGLANHTVLIGRDGSERQIADSAAPIRSDEGKTTGVVLVFRDVTEEYAAAEALRRSEANLRRAQRVAQIGSWRFDLESGAVFASEEARRIYGLGRAEMTIPEVQTIPLPEYREELDRAMRELVEEGQPYDQTFRIRRPSDGKICWIHSVAEYDPERHEVVGTIQDITERKRMEQRLRQTEKMESIGQLAGGVAHDFNNQLAGIMGYSEMLARRLEDPALCKYVDNILIGARRAADLTQQLLAFSRKGQLQSTTVDLHEIVSEVAEILEHSIDRRIVIRRELDAAAATVRGDPSQIQNAVLNLALNARDAMPHGGELTFESHDIELAGEDCDRLGGDLAPGRYLRLRITDTGCGMAEELRRRIFEPFFTTKGQGEGTGMGLAAVYGTVQNHGGAIHVYSEPEVGSTFTLYLPLTGDRPAEAANAAPAAPDLRGLRVLVIDDEVVLREMAVDMLSAFGCTVHAEPDGEAALDWYREHREEVDVVILDMIMPRLSGPEVFAALREIDPDVRVLVASGYSSGGGVSEVLRAGATGFLQKPFQQAELAEALQSAVAPPG